MNTPTKKIPVALYARVSTANNGQDPSMQTREIREYCERRGWLLTGEYVDVGISGTKEKRPELDRLMADAHRRRFDAVVVWRFDRFARSVSHLLSAVAELERSLIVERVRAGLRNARAKGRRLGRPRAVVNVSRIVFLRGQGHSWAQITAETGISKGTAQRTIAGLPKNPGCTLPASA